MMFKRHYFFLTKTRYMSSSVRLSVTLVHPTQAIEIFDNVSTPFPKTAGHLVTSR